MYDPCTVAHQIKYPWVSHSSRMKDGSIFRYRESIITIWHVDPEKSGRGNRGDDSCGWFRPPTTEAERERIRKLGESEYSDIFGKRWATQQGRDYASVCYEPSTYDAIYWTWRRIKREGTRYIWKFGRERGGFLTAGELDEIYCLASSPIDNLRLRVAEVKSAEQCGAFFLTVYSCFKRYHRPWYRHPRWHFWHWRLQIHPLQKLKRWLSARCVYCSRGFGWNESVIGDGTGKRIWHDGCDGHLRGVAMGGVPAE